MNRTLRFVNSRADAGPPERSTDIVVLDTSWTPGPGERTDLIPARKTVEAVLERVNLIDESLERLDAWAAAASLAERFMADGVTWWLHARSFVRLDVHELLLWRHVLDVLAPAGRYETIVIPADRTALVAAARATGPSPTPRIVTVGAPGRIAEFAAPVGRRVRRAGRGLLRRIGLRPDLVDREAVLDARVDALRSEPHGVLAIVRAPSFHVVSTAVGQRRMDPYVSPVLNRLVAQGHAGVTVAIGLDHRRDADWELIERDDHLLPMSFVRRRWSRPEDGAIDASESAARLAGIEDVALDVGGFDVGSPIASIVADLGRWFARQRLQMLVAERLMVDLRPSAIFTAWEAARTSWLGAARRLGIPSLAVQHGVIYPNTPDYCRPLHDGLVRPDVTCVYGPYERDLLIEQGSYEPATVIVTGSPRVDPDEALPPGSPEEREVVRRELGVAGDDRLLVVSTARHAVGDEIHSMTMVGRLLDGPLPGVHVVFKLHPEEESGTHYEELLAGLARAGDYPVPRVSVVRDVDVYRLLRAADAHLGQYSTVLTDAVLTGTPNMIAVGQAWADIIGYVDAGVAVPVRSVRDVQTFMRDPRPPAPDDRARFVDAHYQRGDATGRIASAIVEAMAR